MRAKVVTLLALQMVLLTVCGPLSAHHGGSAYDPKATLTLQATVTGFKFVNPHTQIYFDATDDQGKVIHWACEGRNPGNLVRQGWARETLKPGDHVTITGHPAKDGAKVMILLKVVLANGKELGNLVYGDVAN